METKPIIVLETHGKHETVDLVMIKLFDNTEDAERYCEEKTDKEEHKYWTYCKIVEADRHYEIIRNNSFALNF